MIASCKHIGVHLGAPCSLTPCACLAGVVVCFVSSSDGCRAAISAQMQANARRCGAAASAPSRSASSALQRAGPKTTASFAPVEESNSGQDAHVPMFSWPEAPRAQPERGGIRSARRMGKRAAARPDVVDEEVTADEPPPNAVPARQLFADAAHLTESSPALPAAGVRSRC